MKWIGQHIYDQISRFRNEVHLEAISTSTETDMLVVDSAGKITKRAIDAITVDVSDFMTNGVDNRVLTATGADAMNAEANLTFDGGDLSLALAGAVKFRDANSYVYSPTANDLEIVATDITLDASNVIELEAPTNVTGAFTSDTSVTVGSTAITDDSLVMTPSSGDTFAIVASANGATSLQTIDTAGADAHLTIGADGNVEVAAVNITLDSSSVISLESVSNTNFESGGNFRYFKAGNSDDFLGLTIGTHGDATFTTVDAAAAAAHFEIAADGNITLDAAGNIALEADTTITGTRLTLDHATRNDIKFTNTGDEDHYIRKDGDFLRFRGHDDSTVILELKNNTNGSNAASFPNGTLDVGGAFACASRTLAVSSSTDGDHDGDVVYFGGTTSMTIGKIYHYKSDGTWEIANADAVSTSDGLLGVALGAASDTNGMLLRGMVTLDHDPGAIGDVLYVQSDNAGTPGDATATAPSASGDCVRIIGYQVSHASAGNIWFNPDNTFVEVA